MPISKPASFSSISHRLRQPTRPNPLRPRCRHRSTSPRPTRRHRQSLAPDAHPFRQIGGLIPCPRGHASRPPRRLPHAPPPRRPELLRRPRRPDLHPSRLHLRPPTAPEKIPGSARTTTTSPSIPTRSTQVGAAMRTADGAKFFRLNHQYARRAWLEQQLAASRSVAEIPPTRWLLSAAKSLITYAPVQRRPRIPFPPRPFRERRRQHLAQRRKRSKIPPLRSRLQR